MFGKVAFFFLEIPLMSDTISGFLVKPGMTQRHIGFLVKPGMTRFLCSHESRVKPVR